MCDHWWRDRLHPPNLGNTAAATKNTSRVRRYHSAVASSTTHPHHAPTIHRPAITVDGELCAGVALTPQNVSPRLLALLALGTVVLLYLVLGRSPSSAAPHRTTSKFLVPPEQFIPVDSGRPSWLPAPLAPKRAGMRVPNAVHYVFGLKEPKNGKTEELPYYAYLAIRSALLNLKPEKIYFHYKHLPRGPWWDLIKPHLTLVETHPPTSIFGNKIEHFAHKADLIRLWVMKYSGGIYLDIDMFIVRSFDELLYYPTTLGMEAKTDPTRPIYDPEGLCNAVIISEPGAAFIDRWLASYETFSAEDWAGHSVRMPWQLARQHPDDLQVLNSRAFFWPMWSGQEIDKVFENDDYDFRKTGQYAYHAWESLAMKYLKKLSPEAIRNEDNSFYRLVRPFIGPDDDRVYREWKSRQQ
ncbi:hypothetical protein VHUM_02729 [Vanrija humicola]|uniref:Alpha 1,4-glycosyltransferase domain-containing protein n=1 Tax=Vanrija humicola TaxID=5417 RepID=A0A7D8YV08_VANHU|nr:hypothetical protein VHUM_02729 [Vanrija humicola]